MCTCTFFRRLKFGGENTRRQDFGVCKIRPAIQKLCLFRQLNTKKPLSARYGKRRELFERVKYGLDVLHVDIHGFLF